MIMEVKIKIGDILTVKDFITHLKVIQTQIEQSKARIIDDLISVDLSDTNCYGWHEVELKF